MTRARSTKRWRFVALLRALSLIAAAIVIAHGSVPAPRLQGAMGAMHAIGVGTGSAFVAHAGKAEPARAKSVFQETSSPSVPTIALPPIVAAIAEAAFASKESAPSGALAPLLVAIELVPVARGPPPLG